MPVSDLSLVTRALVSLLRNAILASPEWPSGSADPEISPLPPDSLDGTGNRLGLYLYHVTEDPHFRGLPPPIGPSGRPEAAPLALRLQYQLTAHTLAESETEEALYWSQFLMGLAIRALHDRPIIGDATVVNGVSILQSLGMSGRLNTLKITPRLLAPEEAVSYWTAGNTALRLAAYYEVNAVFLEPPVSPSVAPPVVQPTLGTLPGPPLRLTGSRSSVPSTTPAGALTTTASPAQVAVGEALEILGTSLPATGALVLQREGGTALDADAGWVPTFTSQLISVVVPATLQGLPVVPGTWKASIRGTIGSVPVRSNSTPFSVRPALATPPDTAPGAEVSLTGGVFQDASIPTDDAQPGAVSVWLGSTPLPRGTAVLAAGEWRVVSATELRLRLPTTVSAAQVLPLRVSVGGVDAAPTWIRVA